MHERKGQSVVQPGLGGQGVADRMLATLQRRADRDIGGEDAVIAAGAGLLALNALLALLTYRLLRSGWKIRS